MYMANKQALIEWADTCIGSVSLSKTGRVVYCRERCLLILTDQGFMETI